MHFSSQIINRHPVYTHYISFPHIYSCIFSFFVFEKNQLYAVFISIAAGVPPVDVDDSKHQERFSMSTADAQIPEKPANWHSPWTEEDAIFPTSKKYNWLKQITVYLPGELLLYNLFFVGPGVEEYVLFTGCVAAVKSIHLGWSDTPEISRKWSWLKNEPWIHEWRW